MDEFKSNWHITRILSECEKALQDTIALFYTPLTDNDLLFAGYSQLGGDWLGIFVFFSRQDIKWELTNGPLGVSVVFSYPSRTWKGPSDSFQRLWLFLGGGRGFWILDFLCRRLPLQVNMLGLGHQEGTVNPSQDGSITPGFTHFWALYLLPPARTLMADQRSDSIQVSSCMVNSKEHGQLSGKLHHGNAHSSMGDDYLLGNTWESPVLPNSLLLICHLGGVSLLLLLSWASWVS